MRRAASSKPRDNDHFTCPGSAVNASSDIQGVQAGSMFNAMCISVMYWPVRGA